MGSVELNQAMRELELLKRYPMFQFPVTCAELICNSYLTVDELKDHELIADLESSYTRQVPRAQTNSLLLTARLFLVMKAYERCRECANQVLRREADNLEAYLLLGWLEVFQVAFNADPHSKSSLEVENRLIALTKIIEKATSHGASNELLNEENEGKCLYMEHLLLRYELHRAKNRFESAIEVLDQLAICFPLFTPAVVEKADMLAILRCYDESSELLSDLLDSDPMNLQANILNLVVSIVSKPLLDLQSLVSVCLAEMETMEGKNARLFLSLAMVLSRIIDADCLRARQQILPFLQKAEKLLPGSLRVREEEAFHLRYLGKREKSMAVFESVVDEDEACIYSVMNIVRYSIENQAFEEAETQLNLLNMLQDMIGQPPLLLYLNARLERIHSKQFKEAGAFLERAYQGQMDLFNSSAQKHQELGAPFLFMTQLHCLDPVFLMSMADELLILPIKKDGLASNPSRTTSLALQILDTVHSWLPGSGYTVRVLVNLYLHTRRFNESLALLHHCQRVYVNTDWRLSVLESLTHIKLKDFRAAEEVSRHWQQCNLDVMRDPLVLLVEAEISTARSDYLRAEKVLREAREAQPRVEQTSSRSYTEITEKSMVDFSFISVLLKLKEFGAAKKALIAAQAEYQFTYVGFEYAMLECKLLVAKRQYKQAIGLMSQVPADSPFYIEAVKAKADIYLFVRNDEEKYIACFTDLLDQGESAERYVLLAEAYTRIKNLDSALETYQQALEAAPNDLLLARRVGQLLVRNHLYKKAIDFFSTAVAKSSRTGPHYSGAMYLAYDLAFLLVQLRKYPSAIKELKKTIDRFEFLLDPKTGVELQQKYICCFLLLAKCYEISGSIRLALQMLQTAKRVEEELVSRLKETGTTNTAVICNHEHVLSEICTCLGSHFRTHDMESIKSASYFKEALRYNPGNQEASMQLAEVYASTDQMDHAVALLTREGLDKLPPKQSLLLARAFRSTGELGKSQQYYLNAREACPTDLRAAKGLLKIYFKQKNVPGCLELLLKYEADQLTAGASDQCSSVNYLKGCFLAWKGDTTNSLSYLNRVRKDPTLGRKALYKMIQQYAGLNGASLLSGVGSETSEEEQILLERARTVRQLVGELRSFLSGKEVHEPMLKFATCYRLLVRRKKEDVEEALDILVDFVQDYEGESVACSAKAFYQGLYLLSSCLVLLEEHAKARNQLKRLVKHSSAGYLQGVFEQGFLLLAQLYTESGNLDLSSDLLQRVLCSNASCSEAYEAMAVIKEKQGVLEEAVGYYRQAYETARLRKAAVGYKLASLLLRCGEVVDAVEVAHTVLQQSPGYSCIRSDVLEKAQRQIRL